MAQHKTSRLNQIKATKGREKCKTVMIQKFWKFISFVDHTTESHMYSIITPVVLINNSLIMSSIVLKLDLYSYHLGQGI